MGIKRKNEENDSDNDKKTKLNQTFSNEIFIKNIKDPESSFLGKLFLIKICLELILITIF